MEIEMKRRVHPPTLKVTGCPEREYNGSYSHHGNELNGAPLYESHHKCKTDTNHFYIYKANDGQNGLEWIMTRNQEDIKKDLGLFRSATSAVAPHRVALWERLRTGMMGLSVRWEACADLGVHEVITVSPFPFPFLVGCERNRCRTSTHRKLPFVFLSPIGPREVGPRFVGLPAANSGFCFLLLARRVQLLIFC